MPTLFERASMYVSAKGLNPLSKAQLSMVGGIVSAEYKKGGVVAERVHSDEPHYNGDVFMYPESFSDRMDELIHEYLQPKPEPKKRKRVPLSGKQKPAYSARINK